MVFMQKTVLDGTRCSYKDPHSVCVRGECKVRGAQSETAVFDLLRTTESFLMSFTESGL